MKFYEKPDLEIVTFDTENILRDSNTGNGNGNAGNGDGPGIPLPEVTFRFR